MNQFARASIAGSLIAITAGKNNNPDTLITSTVLINGDTIFLSNQNKSKMKTKSSTLLAFTFKTLLIFTFATVGLASLIKCEAQSVAGKWKEVSGKDFCTEKGVKATGKQFLPQAPQMGGQVLEIRADHTFTSSELMNWVPSDLKLTGTWTLSGDQLNTKLDLVQPDPKTNPALDHVTTIYTVTITGNNMILSLPVKNNPMIVRMEKTYTRM